MSRKPPSQLADYAAPLGPLHLFGPQVEADGVRFTLWCREADTLDLLIFHQPEDLRPMREVNLSPDLHRFGDLWSVLVPGIKAGMTYVYRMNPLPEGLPERQYILDPYAPAVAGARHWGHSMLRRPGQPLHTGAAFPKGVIVDDNFDWRGDEQPQIPWEDMIVYELHLRGYTASETSGVSSPGTYSGLIEKIPYIQSLGVTSVELLPIFEFDEMEYFHANDPRAQLRNFWGYSTLAFFAPNGRYASGGRRGNQVREFKELVKAFHAAGIEVILDVVYNHTAENGENGPAYSFKAIDPDVYYIHDKEHGYHNYSGCGNTLNCNHPVVRQLIIDSLRHWVTEYHIDGFRFDLATVLVRGQDGQLLPNPPLIEQIDEDPILRGVKMIAEAWDAAGGYQVGSFPSERWVEWNGKYRDDIRRFWAGQPGTLSSLATRLMGSEDLYHGAKLGPLKSLNFITCHDGFTLNDLVSYHHKHNLANMEENRDGENHNESRNWGVEGPSQDPDIRELRLQIMKNFFATLFLSHGIPMVTAGDEFGRTQQGSNNAYCQDNEISWVDWTEAKNNAELLTFVKKLIQLRKDLPALRRSGFVGKGPLENVTERLTWIGINGNPPNWGEDQAIAYRLSGKAAHTGGSTDSEDVLVILNGSEHLVKFLLPDTERFKWKMLLYTTSKRRHRQNLGTIFNAGPHSLVIFSAQSNEH